MSAEIAGGQESNLLKMWPN